MHTVARLLAALIVFAFAPAVLAQRSTPIQLLHPSGAAGDRFGLEVAISADTMVVGAQLDDIGGSTNQGSAFVYRWSGTGWALEATLTAADGAANDIFGNAVAISGDTIVIGAASDDIGSVTNQGSAYVFTRSGTTWTQQSRLSASDAAANDSFGEAIAIQGDTIIVGAAQDDVNGMANRGSAYIFTRSGTTWTQQTKLTASDGSTDDLFGVSVGISGDTVVIGAFGDDQSFFNDGSAYIFVRNGAVWTQQARITSPNRGQNDFFGISVGISGDTVVVGAFDDDIGANVDQGSAFVFTRTGTTWSVQASLTAPNGGAGDQFGSAVAISGDTVVIGAPLDTFGANAQQGSAWVFSRIGSIWLSPDLRATAGDAGASDRFGTSVAISGDYAVVGTPAGTSTDRGAASVFIRTGVAWVEQAVLLSGDGLSGDNLGVSVAIEGDTVVVGANLDDINGRVDQGAAFVFNRAGSIWSLTTRLVPNDGAPNDQFGRSVAISGATILVGAPLADIAGNADQGAVYVFARNAIWSQQAKLTRTDGAPGDQFGFAVAVAGDTAVATSPTDDVGANADQGSATVFVRSGTTWSPQATLTADDGAAGDQFGSAVSISGNTVVIGAASADVGANADQGAAYLFARSGTDWNQRVKLTADDGAAGDQFGSAVCLNGESIAVGAPLADVGANTNQGAAYFFARAGTVWSQQAKLTAPDGAAMDTFGSSVAVSASTTIVGSPLDNAPLVDQGSAWFFDISTSDLPLAHNDSLDLSYPTIPGAVSAAQSDQQITATQTSWRTVSALDTAGRSLILRSDGDLRTPSASPITLTGTSSLNAATDRSAEIYGQLESSANAIASVVGNSFLLGSRGSLSARASSTLTITAPSSRLEGPALLEQNAALVFTGSVDTIAPTTAGPGSSITAGNTFTNVDVLTLTDATIASPLCLNRDTADIFGATTVFGPYTNNDAALTTVHSGTFAVFGILTSRGLLVGTLCSGCPDGPNLVVVGTLGLGAGSTISFPFSDSTISVAGAFDCAINSNARFDLSLAELNLNGGGTEQAVEVMSNDVGADLSGFDRTLAGRYPIRTLHIGNASTIRLVDNADNDGRGQAACEALYVNRLIIESGARLINPACRIYYNILINRGGVVDVPTNLVLVAPPCPVDFNADLVLNADDLADFITGYFNVPADPATDFNADGTINADDLADFITAYFNGC